MSLTVYVHWWIIPAFLVTFGVVTLVRSRIKHRNDPKWIGNGTFMFPNLSGSFSDLTGILFIILAIVFIAGHYMK